MEKIGATPIGNGNLDAIGERKRRLVKNPNMDYRNLHTTNLFRDIMIIVLRRSDCQIFSLQHHYLLAQSYSNRIIIQK